MLLKKSYLLGEEVSSMATEHYSYYTSADGLCCYSRKEYAVKAAKGAGAVAVFSPKGRVVWSPFADFCREQFNKETERLCPS